MATFLELVNEISQEINKGGLGQVDTEIRQAINDAVAFYEMMPFRFNQVIDTSITTTSGTFVYALPADVLDIHRLQVEFSATQVDRVDPVSWEQFQEVRENNTIERSQRIDWFAVFADQIFLYPTPAGAYQVNIFGVKRLTGVPFESASATNAWTNRARMLIKARAKYLLCMHRVMNADWAQAYALDEQAQLVSLQREMSQFNASRQLRPDMC